MNYKYLKRLCDEQRKQIVDWKNYCHKLECFVLELNIALDGVPMDEAQRALMRKSLALIQKEVL